MFPLTSYNHFTVEHIAPWELPIEEEYFFGRHWTRPVAKDLGLKPHLVTDAEIERLGILREPFERMDWQKLTPWRLAIDRLDDAVFKLECASPDAILDLVIGLESVFIEADSRQESTHKVATRVSRFLEQLLSQRQELFRKTKQIYKSRSTLAHGQRWSLEAEGISRVEEAAQILANALRRMVELKCSEVDHQSLDLS